VGLARLSVLMAGWSRPTERFAFVSTKSVL
jgi:hypothetical protein